MLVQVIHEPATSFGVNHDWHPSEIYGTCQICHFDTRPYKKMFLQSIVTYFCILQQELSYQPISNMEIQVEMSVADAEIFNTKMAELQKAESFFKKACHSVNLLDQKLDILTSRYQRAENQKGFRYNLRLQLATLEGMRASYYEYACLKGQAIVDLRCLLSDMLQGC